MKSLVDYLPLIFSLFAAALSVALTARLTNLPWRNILLRKEYVERRKPENSLLGEEPATFLGEGSVTHQKVEADLKVESEVVNGIGKLLGAVQDISRKQDEQSVLLVNANWNIISMSVMRTHTLEPTRVSSSNMAYRLNYRPTQTWPRAFIQSSTEEQLVSAEPHTLQ